MRAWSALLSGLGCGAAAMYFLDPLQGRRRRALIRDRIDHLEHQTQAAVGKTRRDLGNRTRGTLRSLGGLVRRGPVSDPVLEERVRAKMGRYTSHPGAIEVRAEDGKVTLSGPILEREVRGVLAAVSHVRGVREVESLLQPHERREEVPGLQGGAVPPGAELDLLQVNWAPATRALAGAAGGALTALAAARRDPLSLLLGAAGLGLLARSVTNQPLARLAGLGERPRGVQVQKTLRIDAPLKEVWEIWSHPENLPRIMEHLAEVQPLGDGLSRWTVHGPAGLKLGWSAEVTEERPGELLAWRTLPGSEVESEGTVHFDDEEDGKCRIHVQMAYNPPGGLAGHLVARLFGADPKSAMDDDLLRFKSLFENGTTRAHGHRVEAGELLH